MHAVVLCFFVSFYVVMEAYACTIANFFLVLICTYVYSTKFTLERINLFILRSPCQIGC